jgi:hypothetical protein
MRELDAAAVKAQAPIGRIDLLMAPRAAICG